MNECESIVSRSRWSFQHLFRHRHARCEERVASRSRTLCVFEVRPLESWLYQLVKILKEKLASAVQDSDVLDVPGSQLPAASI